MKTEVSDTAIFRLSVLGDLTSQVQLSRGEIQCVIKRQAEKHYAIPNSRRTRVSPRTIEKWYYLWKKYATAGLEPKARHDKGASKLTESVKDRILTLKLNHMGRSINTILKLLQQDNIVVSRSSVYRLLRSQHLSSRVTSDAPAIERRKFEAEYPNDIWYGDVMYGPKITEDSKLKQTYMVSLMDDASRLITHSQFTFDESAESIEYVLKQALLKRGIPKRLIVDNGAAYQSKSLKQICARLNIHLIYCRPYEPEGKGKLERWHRTVREQFIGELPEHANTLHDLNARLWAWVDAYYHQSPHKGLDGQSPLSRYRRHIEQVNAVRIPMDEFDKIFYHRVKRYVNKDATFSLNGRLYEVPYALSGQSVIVCLIPSLRKPQIIEDDSGKELGPVYDLDQQRNLNRKRQRPKAIKSQQLAENLTDQAMAKRKASLIKEY